jgi:methionyl aminopeptidase
MIRIKTAEQIEGIRKSSQLAAKTLLHLEQFAIPGVSTAKIDAEAETFMRDHGAIPACLGYRGFPKSVCTSLNEVVAHGIPSDRKSTRLNSSHLRRSRMPSSA